MTVIQTKYFPGRFGLGTEYSLWEMPLEYSRSFVNRFINIRGDAEKRGGIERVGTQVGGGVSLTGLHEFVAKDGTTTLFTSANGMIWRFNETTSDWDLVLTGKDQNSRLLSVQMQGKLIFVNGVDRNFYTDDGGNSFKELKAIVEQGRASGATNSTTLQDSQITSWTAQTFVTNNDLIFNYSVSAYGIVTSVGASNLSNSTISASATGIGVGTRNPTSGDIYEIIDLVELNIIPTGLGTDNFATLTAGSSTTVIAVSGVDFSTTEARVGDFIYNTTRNAVTRMTSVSANINVVSVTSQTANDTVTFFKSAMPIATYPHVHYGRLYLIDERDPGVVRISGVNDPQDFTTFQKTLESTSFAFMNAQPQAEKLLALKTFQQYLVAGGSRNVYAYSGTDPLVDTTAASTNFIPIGLFPQGCASRFGLESIGGSMIFAANDGLRNFAANFNANTFQTSNISEAIKSELALAINNKSGDPDEIQCVHYPRRNWLMFKVGDTIYNYNYTPYYQAGVINSNTYGSFSKFTGKFANQNVYYVRANGDLICAGAGGRVYLFDSGNFDDDGDNILTILETGFLTLQEPQQSTQIKSTVYIKPVFETSQPIAYTIQAFGGFTETSTDEVETMTQGVGQVGFAVVGSSPIGGSRVYMQKLPLRCKGERFRISISTESTAGPDIITGFTVYGNILGKL